MKERPKITCERCGGKGEAPLSLTHWLPMQVVSSLGSATVAQVHSRIIGVGVGVTAINNRLENLRRLGFLKRTKAGHEWVYSER